MPPFIFFPKNFFFLATELTRGNWGESGGKGSMYIKDWL
jgi:hypothetical protein